MLEGFVISKFTQVVLLSSCLLSIPVLALAEQDMRDVVRDERGNVVMNSFGNCVRTRWASANDPCAPPAERPAPREERRVSAPIGIEERTVYFEFDKHSLTLQARERLNNLARILKSDRNVKEAQIVGYADRIGTPSYNERLSQKRAESVRGHLSSQGVINSRVTETRWLGESVPATNCPDTLSRPALIACLQKDRRVEVEVEYYPQGQLPNRR